MPCVSLKTQNPQKLRAYGKALEIRQCCRLFVPGSGVRGDKTHRVVWTRSEQPAIWLIRYENGITVTDLRGIRTRFSIELLSILFFQLIYILQTYIYVNRSRSKAVTERNIQKSSHVCFFCDILIWIWKKDAVPVFLWAPDNRESRLSRERYRRCERILRIPLPKAIGYRSEKAGVRGQGSKDPKKRKSEDLLYP